MLFRIVVRCVPTNTFKIHDNLFCLSEMSQIIIGLGFCVEFFSQNFAGFTPVEGLFGMEENYKTGGFI